MNVREGLVDRIEAGRFSGPVGNLGALALHGALDQTVMHGGLEITYPNGRTREYGDQKPELAIRLKSARPIGRLLVDPTLALGEGYILGEVDFEDPTDPNAVPPIDRLAKLMAENGFFNLDQRIGRWIDHLRPPSQPNRQRFHREQVQQHYDIGNDFYDLVLDDTRTYSCAYWDRDPSTMTLEEAQISKIRHILRKARIQDGETVLDVGSGWGHLLVAAAKEHDINGLGITLSNEQLAASVELAEREGVAERIRFMLIDILDLAKMPKYRGLFDCTLSVGMFEHMGETGADRYFKAMNFLTRDGGRTFNHYISQQRNKPAALFISRYIFPGGHLHPIGNVLNSAAHYGFRHTNTESLREHYALTLSQEHGWWGRFEEHLEVVRELWEAGRINHPKVHSAEEFIRMQRFYFAMSYGGFKYGQLDLAQSEWTKGIDTSAPLTRNHIYESY